MRNTSSKAENSSDAAANAKNVPPRSSASASSQNRGSPANSHNPPEGVKKSNDSVYVLHSPDGEVEVDIIFFHGLQIDDYKDAYWKTWSSDGNTIWPRTLLSSAFPQARILAVSYDSCARKSDTGGRVDLHLMGENLVKDVIESRKACLGQNNPVILVGHSLGGIAIKQFIVAARKILDSEMRTKRTADIQNFLQNLCGIFYYSTPHNSSLGCANVLSKFPSKSDVLRFLKTLCYASGRLNDEFRKLREGRHILSSTICETRSTILNGVRYKVVMEASARIDIDNVYFADEDHISICKPKDETSASFKCLKEFIMATAGESGQKLTLKGGKVLESKLKKSIDGLKEHMASELKLALKGEKVPESTLKKARPFSTLTLSGGQSEEYSSIFTDNSMPWPAAARMDNQNAQTKKEDMEWKSGVSQHVKTQVETSSVEPTRSVRPEPVSESVVQRNDSGSNSYIIDMGPMKQEYETRIGDFQIRSDIQSLGFTSWDQEFNPHKMLLLCESNSSTQRANVLFFHMEAMASLFGVGLAFSKVSIVFCKQLGYEIRIEEVLEEDWKNYWISSCENTWQPILFERGDEILENREKRSVLCLTRDEALSRFGICVDEVEAQEFTKLNNSNPYGPEDANNYQPKWIKLFMDLVQQVRRCNRAEPNCNDDEQMVEEGLWNHMCRLAGEDCQEKKGGALLCSNEGGLLNSHDHDHSFHEGQNDKVDQFLHIAPHRIDMNYIKIPGKVDMMCNRMGSKSSDGSSRHETGEGQTLQGSKEGCEQSASQKRKHSGEGHHSIGRRVALKSGVKVRECEPKNILKIIVVFLHRRCDFYSQNISSGVLEQATATADMPQSFIKPTLDVEFMYNPGGVKSLVTTLGSEFQFDNEKPGCQVGWYQDEFKLSFQHSDAEHFDVNPVCDVDFHRIISDVVHGDLEVTRQSELVRSELVEHNVNGSAGLQLGFVALTPSISGSRRREDSKQSSDSNQHVNRVGTCRLEHNPSIAITSACKSGILEYKLHSLIDPVMPDNRQWKHIKATGMYSNFEIKVAGQWYILEEGKETYEFSVKKTLSRYIDLGGADVVPNGNVSAGGGVSPVQNINYPGGSDAAQQTVLQIFTRKFILNHNFSEFFESLKRPDPYTWVLQDSSNRGNQVPTAIKLSDLGPVPVGGSPPPNLAPAPVNVPP